MEVVHIEAAKLSIAVDAQTRDAEKGISRVDKLLGGVGRSFKNVAGIAGGFVLAQGLLKAPGVLMDMAQAAADDAASVAKLQQAVTNAGEAWDGHTGALNTAIEASQKLGYTDDATRDSLALLMAQTGSSAEAMRRLSTAQDLARGTGMSLEMASKLVGKISAENTEVLKKYGITLGEAATEQDALNAIDALFGGQAGKFAETAAGQWAAAKIQMSEAAESIGALLLPLFTRLAVFLATTTIPALQRFIDIVGPRITEVVSSATMVLGQLAGILRGPLQAAWTQARDGVLTFKQALEGDWSDGKRIRPLHRILGLLGTVIHDQIVPAVTTLAGFFTDTLWPAFERGRGVVAGLIGDLTSGDWAGVASTIGSSLLGALDALSGLAWDVGGWLVGRIAAVDWSGLATTIGTGILSALTTVAGLVWDAASWVAGLITDTDWSGIAGTILDGIITGFAAVVDWGTRFYEWAHGQITSVDWSGLSADIIGHIITGFDTVTDAGTRVYTWLSGVLEQVNWDGIATTIWSKLNTALTAAETAAQGLKDALTNIDLTTSNESLNSFVELLKPRLEEAALGAALQVEALKKLIGDLGTTAELAFPGVTQLLTFLGSVAVLGGLDALVLQLDTTTESLKLVDLAVQALNRTLGFMNDTVLPTLASTAKTTWDLTTGIPGVIISGWNTISSATSTAVDTVLGLVQTLWSESVGKVSGMSGEIITKVSELATSVVGFFGDLATDSLAKAQELWDGLVTTFGNIYTTVTTKIGETVDEAVRLAGTLPGRAVDAVGNLSSTLYGAGVDLVQGLIDGISSMLQSLRNKVSEIGDILGDVDVPFFSPPGEAGYEIGTLYAKNIATGISDMLPLIAQAVAGVGSILGSVPQFGVPGPPGGTPGLPGSGVGVGVPMPGAGGGYGTSVNSNYGYGSPYVPTPADLAQQFANALGNITEGGMSSIAAMGKSGQSGKGFAFAGGVTGAGSGGLPIINVYQTNYLAADSAAEERHKRRMDAIELGRELAAQLAGVR